jgi:hypothetical protein
MLLLLLACSRPDPGCLVLEGPDGDPVYADCLVTQVGWRDQSERTDADGHVVEWTSDGSSITTEWEGDCAVHRVAAEGGTPTLETWSTCDASGEVVS